MKTLKDFEDDLNKCSKCGLCEVVCPLFKIVPNDCVASKGKFIMLHGVTKGDLELSDNINKYVDMCLKCGKCRSFCPSDIDVCQILSVAKFEYMKNKFVFKLIKFFQSERIFNNIVRFAGKLFGAGKKSKKTVSENALKVLWFGGCVNQMFPFAQRQLDKIFKNRDIEIISPEFDCCGLPFLSGGNLERFKTAAKNNATAAANIEYDYFVTDCASCESTVLDYGKYFPDLSAISSEKSLNWGDIIARENLRFKFKKPVRVTFHKPCHLKDDLFFEKIIANCENVGYVKCENYDDCCGFAGTFSLKFPKLSGEISRRKAQNIKNTGADYVITTCPGCILGLKKGLVGSKIKVAGLLEFLAEADEIL